MKFTPSLRSTPLQGARRKQSGIILVECLVYVAIVMTVVGLGTTLFFKFLSFHQDLDRNAADIARALKAGERWRADIRKATGPIRAFRESLQDYLEIPAGNQLIIYQFDQTNIWRHKSGETSPALFLEKVKECRFVSETRKHATAWRWEMELQTTKKTVRIQPQFTFLSVSKSHSANG
ncbi:MAG: hypothetical protein M2R45_04787 [Verrucomicrobia subdivision 3 bacterium]|nr:hypothetical protein [Limisphaerales bacterium]MCS1417432.1 hypothetical protein [Limisphaerales bacterium]